MTWPRPGEQSPALIAGLIADLQDDLAFLARGGTPAPGKTREQNAAEIREAIAIMRGEKK